MKAIDIVDILSHFGITHILQNESMKKHTSIKIGGPVKLYICVQNQQELILCIKLLIETKSKYYILGNGSNTLVADNGYDGIVVDITKLKKIKVSTNSIYAQAGLGLFSLGKVCRQFGLSGLEFCYGIPGTVGGAITMNAGAFGKNIGEQVDYVKVLENGTIKKYSSKKMQFAYRHSIVEEKKLIVLGAKFLLKNSTLENVETLQNEFFHKKLDSQPYTELSFGSVFKRCNGTLAISKIIDELGLKGYSVGGASISDKHAGFIVNNGKATCQDCLLLIQYIQAKVKEAYGFVPELEVKLLGV